MKYTNKFIVLGTAVVTLAIFIFTACKKNDSTPATDTGFSSDQVTTEKTYDDAQTISDQAYSVGAGGSLANFRTTAVTGGGCATISRDSSSTADSLIVDFGSSNCLCNDGNYRRGKVIVIKTGGGYLTTGSVRTIGFDNYYVNDNQVTGTRTVTNMGLNSYNQPYYEVVVNGSIILANSAGTITYTADRKRTWINGFNTPAVWTDDQYQIEDMNSTPSVLTRANGNVISNQITNPVIIDVSCKWKFVQGTVVHTITNATTSATRTATLDYGTGTCDALATLTYNGHTYNISIK